ncbi:replication initiator [Jiangella gansuensis]|uniref:replication initiator n=1 Tax=Jiangella gansuensis TaxID=281473 RepID=UPI000683FA55|nr:replication initiator [Jiangella gansuensis]
MSTRELSHTELVFQLASLSRSRAGEQARGCVNPIRLTGSSTTVHAATGEVVRTYSSDDEPDGHTYVRCGNRRAAVCPSCSREYKGDAWHLLSCGLAGGKTIPDTVAEHPATFATFTAPSFGAVHRHTRPTNGKTAPCRARRDKPRCPHGRPLSCVRRHDADDPQVGQPLCFECYDYTAHAAWQWWAPQLWRYFTMALRRRLARTAGMSMKTFTSAAKVSYTRVVEFQARGVVHFHVVIRLDGPDGPTTPPQLDLTVTHLEDAVRHAAAHAHKDVPLPGGQTLRLRWGRQLDLRSITPGAGRDNREGSAHPHQVAAYLAKYLTKSTEDFGLPVSGKLYSAGHAAKHGATPHAVRLIKAAQQLVPVNDDYARLKDRYATLGYRGHPITKSRAYSVTFGALRTARRHWRQRRAQLPADADVRDVLDVDQADTDDATTLLVIGDWRYAGRGYLDTAAAANATRSANLARIRRADAASSA